MKKFIYVLMTIVQYIAFGAAGHADQIKAIKLSDMAQRYAAGELQNIRICLLGMGALKNLQKYLAGAFLLQTVPEYILMFCVKNDENESSFLQT